nr:unnamed protein product [Callosobruchus chinensis]
MAHLNLKKKSKRQPARQRYKILKKIRDHNKKARREAKKNPIRKKQEIIQVPNICPFKEDILKEAEAYKKRIEEEKKLKKEQARLERQSQNKEKKKEQLSGGLDKLSKC